MRLIDAEGIRVKPEFMHNVCGMAMIRVEDIVRILNEQPTIEPEPHWIPCGERLPEEKEERYWVCLDSGGQCQCRWTNDIFGLGANKWSEWGWSIMDKPMYTKIVAWMPLPEPYQERADE